MSGTFKLDKHETALKAELIEKMNAARTDLEAATEIYNADLAKAKDALQPAIETFNEVVSAIREFAADVAGQADADISDKSDRWQEGERGQAANAWKDEWEGASFDDIEIELPTEIELPEIDHADTLDQLPDEAEL